MKKLLFILLSLSMVLTFTGCQSKEPEVITLVMENIVEPVANDIVNVSIRTHEDGRYNIMSPVELTYYEGKISEISINEPILLSFNVSSFYNGGVYILDITKGEELISELSVIAEKIDNPELVRCIKNVIEKIQQSGPITGAST